MPPSAPGPRGNQSRRFPPSDKPTGPPSATGAEGGIQVRSIEYVKRMIALIRVEKCSDGSPPSEAHGGGGEGLG